MFFQDNCLLRPFWFTQTQRIRINLLLNLIGNLSDVLWYLFIREKERFILREISLFQFNASNSSTEVEFWSRWRGVKCCLIFANLISDTSTQRKWINFWWKHNRWSLLFGSHCLQVNFCLFQVSILFLNIYYSLFCLHLENACACLRPAARTSCFI